MRLLYDINYEVAGSFFLIVVCIFFKIQYSVKQKEAILFQRFLLYLLVAEILDVVTGVMLSFADIVPPWANMVGNTLYFIFDAICEYQVVNYLSAYIPQSRATRLVSDGLRLIFIAFLALLGVNFANGCVFSIVDGVYTHGPLYLAVFMMPLFYMLIALIMLVIFRNKLERRVLFSFSTFIILTAVAVLLQAVFFPNVLLCLFGASLAALIMLFSLETPDYEKLTIAMNELKVSNEALDALKGNLQQEVKVQTAEAKKRLHQVEEMSLHMVQVLAHAIDAKDPYTNGHSNRVAEYSVLLAADLGWPEEKLENLRHAASLHDIGKIGVPDSILNKPTRLTDVEYQVIKTHTTIGYDILRNMESIPEADATARYHHERFDGTGYPDGLRGEQIPLVARIVGIADSFDAMSSRRIYRRSLPMKVIRAELEKGRGSQFDPELLDRFLNLLEAGKMDEILKQESGEDEKTEYRGAGIPTDLSGGLDYLTGLPGRGIGVTEIAEAISRENGYLVFIDVDDMQRINRTHGNLVGDSILRTIGASLKSLPYKVISCRLGGDEFICYFPGFGRIDVERCLDNLLRDIHSIDAPELGGETPEISMGISECTTRDSYPVSFERADKALYFMKQSGKKGYSFYREEYEEGRRNSRADLDHYVQALRRDGAYVGPMAMDMDSFSRVYEYVRNMEGRFHNGFQLVMITLEESRGERMYIDETEKAMNDMEATIRQVIRSVDVCTRASNVQFLLILMGARTVDVAPIIERIFRGFYQLCGNDHIQPSYDVADWSKTT